MTERDSSRETEEIRPEDPLKVSQDSLKVSQDSLKVSQDSLKVSQDPLEVSPCGRVGGCCGTCKEEQASAEEAARDRAPSDPETPSRARPGLPILTLAALTLLLPACGPGAEAEAVSQAELEAALQEVREEMEDRFSPGLHSQMVEMQHRHAALWFAGDAGNWGLTDYMIHELEELVEDMEEINPVYREVQVAELLREMTVPAIERMEDAVEAEDRAAFAQAYDQLTTACNACHVASDRAAIVMQRPTAPPLTNLRYAPER
jgi:hypothetical protein